MQRKLEPKWKKGSQDTEYYKGKQAFLKYFSYIFMDIRELCFLRDIGKLKIENMKQKIKVVM